MEIELLNQYFEVLRKEYHGTKVMVYEDAMVYYGLGKYAEKTEKELNELISKLNLPLTAISNTTKGIFFSDTVRVEYKN